MPFVEAQHTYHRPLKRPFIFILKKISRVKTLFQPFDLEVNLCMPMKAFFDCTTGWICFHTTTLPDA